MTLLKFLRLGQDVAESTAIPDCPQQKECSAAEQQRRGPALEDFDSFRSLENDCDLNRPEDCECDRRAAWQRVPSRPSRLEKRVERKRSDPGLNSEPTAGHDRSQNGGDVGAAHTKARPAKDGKRNPVFRSGVGV